ncbi:hypothetical protein TTHERM_00430080 (macronuclear) [Tetrahymena thermophila SB210]|uniref:Uncharacterized protein n=1 Tax=Tetrahymena thermophila (strain SB210) TaxID=312017 RepID=Q231F2_TETTS|nr:hypothetical protein TTHERM_00430080 [Tetrahymena thermophila SB210]EAR91087.2 hypothetical protein TTHERM_00430080 [Tetrahymena thermophila SB210]|eukprot:XP_001011332.2 hypothetical protein TTHERM_00430080 [Tetrahymena thermophila SB210]
MLQVVNFEELKKKKQIWKAIIMEDNLLGTLEQNDDEILVYNLKKQKLIFKLKVNEKIKNIQFSSTNKILSVMTQNSFNLYKISQGKKYKQIKVALKGKNFTFSFNSWYFFLNNLLFINSFNMKSTDGIRIFNIFNSDEKAGFIEKNFQVKCYKIIDKSTVIFGILNAIIIYRLEQNLDSQASQFEKINLFFEGNQKQVSSSSSTNDLQQKNSKQINQIQIKSSTNDINGYVNLIEKIDKENILLVSVRTIYIFSLKEKVITRMVQQYQHPSEIINISFRPKNIIASCCLSGLAVLQNIDTSQIIQLEDLNVSQKDAIFLIKNTTILVIKKH